MSDLRGHAVNYLALRRGLGYKLTGEERLLLDFITFVQEAGAAGITTDLAVCWASDTAGSSQAYLARRLRVVRSFARHLQAFEPATEVPPADLFPAGKHRPTPYIYTPADIACLMTAARCLRPSLRAATFEGLIGLLASTGMRVGEAMALDDDDIDWNDSLLVVRQTKYNKFREVLLHPSTLDALATYKTIRIRLSPLRSTASFFVTTRGTRLSHEAIQPTFRQLVVQAGVGQAVSSSRPRVHAFRHTFAVNTLLKWSTDGGDVSARMPLLSTYLGHSCPAATYWYLSAIPELLALAAARRDRHYSHSRR
jgi:integrase/recombinase XerD